MTFVSWLIDLFYGFLVIIQNTTLSDMIFVFISRLFCPLSAFEVRAFNLFLQRGSAQLQYSPNPHIVQRFDGICVREFFRLLSTFQFDHNKTEKHAPSWRG